MTQSLPASSSVPSSSSPSSPSSSTEGFRDDPPSSSLPTHQLRTSLTADTTDTGLRDKDSIENETHERGGESVEECDGPHVQRVGVDASLQIPNDPGTREGEREGEDGANKEGVRAGGVDSRKQGLSRRELTETETSPEMLTNAEGVDLSNARPEKTSESITPSSSLPPSLPDTPQGMRRLNRPPPLVTPTATPPLLMSSKESPTSPFFIPSNPFLSVVGRMPRFQWAAVHVTLLDSLLRSLLNIIQKW